MADEEIPELSKKISPRMRRTRFVREFLKDHNATQAAIRAGYSEKTANQQGSRLLANVKVKAAIEQGAEKIADKMELSVERIAQEIARLAFFDPRKLFNDDGSPKAIAELDDDTAAALAGMDVTELFEGKGDERAAVGIIKKYKLADKTRALEMAGRYRKMFTDKLELGAGDQILERLMSGRKRAAK